MVAVVCRKVGVLDGERGGLGVVAEGEASKVGGFWGHGEVGLLR